MIDPSGPPDVGTYTIRDSGSSYQLVDDDGDIIYEADESEGADVIFSYLNGENIENFDAISVDEGVYELHETVHLSTPNVELNGTGRSTEFRITGNHTAFQCDADGLTVRDLSINADGNYASNAGVWIRSASDVLLDGLSIHNGFKTSIIYTDCDNLLIRDCTVRGLKETKTYYGIASHSHGAEGWQTDSISTNVTLLGNSVSRIHYNSIPLYGVRGFSVIGNECFDAGHSHIACSPAWDGIIRDNVTYGIDTSVWQDRGGEAGIEIEWKRRGYAEGSRDVLVTGNTIYDCDPGIIVRVVNEDVDPVEFRTQDATIRRNVVHNNTVGIRILEAERVNIAGNLLRDNDQNFHISEKNISKLNIDRNTTITDEIDG